MTLRHRLRTLLIVLALGPPILSQVAMIFGDDKPPAGSAKKEGLSLAISLDKKSYRQGEDIRLSFTLKNELDQDLYIGDSWYGPNYQEVGPERHFELHVKDDQNAALYFWSDLLSEGGTSGIRKVFLLKPGQTYDGRVYLISNNGEVITVNDFGHKIRSGSFADMKTRKKHVLGADGHAYTLTLVYQVNPKSHGVVEPPKQFSDKMLWKGKIETTPLEFRIEQSQKPNR